MHKWLNCCVDANYLIESVAISNLLQLLQISSNTRLNHVLTTLGNLYHIYSDPDLDAEVRDKVLGSLKKHWAATDQDPFIAAVVLNLFLCGTCLARAIPLLTPIGLCNMLKHLHLQVFKVPVDSNFQSAFMDYYNNWAEFSLEFMAL